MKKTNLKAFKHEVQRNYELHFSNRHASVNLSSFCNRLDFDLNGARVYQTETPYTHNSIIKWPYFFIFEV